MAGIDCGGSSGGKSEATSDAATGGTRRAYQGEIDYTLNDGPNTRHLSGTVAWTETGPGSDTLLATGMLNAEINLDGCDAFSGQVTAAGELYWGVPDDGYYTFSIDTSEAMVTCNGVLVPVNFLFTGPPCDGTSDASIIPADGMLVGTAECGYHLTWHFLPG